MTTECSECGESFRPYRPNQKTCSEICSDARYQKISKAIIQRWRKLQRETNPQFKIGLNLRRRLLRALKGNTKPGSAVRDLGCSIDELKLYLESMFDANMAWNNYGRYWNIDHIIPLSAIDLSNREQLLVVVHWTNLRPMKCKENICRRANVTKEERNRVLAAYYNATGKTPFGSPIALAA